MEMLQASGDNSAMKHLEKLYKDFNLARVKLNKLLNKDGDAFSRQYKVVDALRKEFKTATVGAEAVRQHEERTNAAAQAQSEVADADFEEWATRHRTNTHEHVNPVIITSKLFDDTKIVDSVRDGQESDCPICTEHLSHTKDAGNVYAIDTESNKKSNEITTPISCGHKFHKSCIYAWVKHNQNCPICRGRVLKIRKANEESKGKEGGKKRVSFSSKNKKYGKRRTMKKSFFNFFS
jgi:hypothetical protein